MEQSLSSLTFKGSIMGAIAEAKQLKKLFVVYISGDNPESHNLEASMWMDSRVAESVSNFCILLHISEGSVDAANFSAIYPQKSAPCTTAIGYNGTQLWQYEGLVAADTLASSIEKAWLSLHIQETTAAYLTTALASKKQTPCGIPDGDLAEEGSSSRTNVLPPENVLNGAPEVGPSENYEIVEENNYIEHASKHDEASTQSSLANEIGNGEIKDGTSSSEIAEISINPCLKDLSKNEDESLIPEESVTGQPLEAKKEASIKIAKEAIEANRGENIEVEKVNFLESSASKSSDVHLNIRLPDGSNLQIKFSVVDTLGMVKDHVDEKKTSNFGSYDLAIPYPRKVFGEKDLSKTLQDLDLFGRQTLVVVLHHRANPYPKGGSSSRDETNFTRDGSSSGVNDGYWAYMRRILSYMNPFSYLGGSANSPNTAQESQNNMWQYSPNPSLQDDLRGTGGSSGVYSSNRSTDTTNRSSNTRSRQHTSSPFGSNIHTLKHDEDDRFSDRNAFWNGNSTQFGGDNDSK